jgi:hypothetical protein
MAAASAAFASAAGSPGTLPGTNGASAAGTLPGTIGASAPSMLAGAGAMTGPGQPGQAGHAPPLAGTRGAALPRAAPPPGRARWISVGAATVVIAVAALGVLLLAHHGKPPAASSQKRQATTQPPVQPTRTPAVNGLIRVTPGVASQPHATIVVSLLNRYFTAINDHDFAAYSRLFSPSLRGGLSKPTFRTGYASARDSRATLHGITSAGAGQLDAAVTFVSRQKPAVSATHSACTAWSISLYLRRHGRGYVIESPPTGYAASARSCS